MNGGVVALSLCASSWAKAIADDSKSASNTSAPMEMLVIRFIAECPLIFINLFGNVRMR